MRVRPGRTALRSMIGDSLEVQAMTASVSAIASASDSTGLTSGGPEPAVLASISETRDGVRLHTRTSRVAPAHSRSMRRCAWA